jgi:hypothetical protein
MKLSLQPPDNSPGQGHSTVVELKVHNPGPDWLLVDEAKGDSPFDPPVRWSERKQGLFVYDAREDVYRYQAAEALWGEVPVCRGLLGPGWSLESFLQLKTLTPGPRRAKIRVTYRSFSEAEVTRRVYRAPDTTSGGLVYEPVVEPSSAQGALIVRGRDLEPQEASLDCEFEVTPDPTGAPDAILERAGPGSELVDLCRRLGGAWVARGADGSFLLTRGEESLRCGPNTLDAAVFRFLDRGVPFEPVRLVFWSEAALALRDAGSLPLLGADNNQPHIQPDGLWELFSQANQRGLTVRAGLHASITEGLILR